MKRALVIRHVVHEGLAGYRAPIERAGYEIQRVAACQTDFAALDLVSPDLLVVMGGPMGVYDTDAHPWISDEIAAIAARLAAALGARVYAGPVREVGFAPIALSETALESPLRHVADVDVLHWHGDTFDLPEGTELLASTLAYPNQAFRRGDRLLALQFHAEMGEDPRFHDWMADEAYIRGAGVDPAALQDDHDRLGPPAVRAGERMIADWLAALEG